MKVKVQALDGAKTTGAGGDIQLDAHAHALAGEWDDPHPAMPSSVSSRAPTFSIAW